MQLSGGVILCLQPWPAEEEEGEDRLQELAQGPLLEV
jgi:hypothetical protein